MLDRGACIQGRVENDSTAGGAAHPAVRQAEQAGEDDDRRVRLHTLRAHAAEAHPGGKPAEHQRA